MAWYKTGRSVRKRGDAIAIAENCCDCFCCGCNWLDLYVQDAEAHGCVPPPGKGRLRVDISGAGLGGYVILGPNIGDTENCLSWANNVECGDHGLENLTDNCGWNINTVRFFCPVGATLISQYVLAVAAETSAGCAFERPAYQSGQCGPPLLLNYRSVAQDVGGPFGPCPGFCLGQINFTVQSIDPWPLP